MATVSGASDRRVRAKTRQQTLATRYDTDTRGDKRRAQDTLELPVAKRTRRAAPLQESHEEGPWTGMLLMAEGSGLDSNLAACLHPWLARDAYTRLALTLVNKQGQAAKARLLPEPLATRYMWFATILQEGWSRLEDSTRAAALKAIFGTRPMMPPPVLAPDWVTRLLAHLLDSTGKETVEEAQRLLFGVGAGGGKNAAHLLVLTTRAPAVLQSFAGTIAPKIPVSLTEVARIIVYLDDTDFMKRLDSCSPDFLGALFTAGFLCATRNGLPAPVAHCIARGWHKDLGERPYHDTVRQLIRVGALDQAKTLIADWKRDRGAWPKLNIAVRGPRDVADGQWEMLAPFVTADEIELRGLMALLLATREQRLYDFCWAHRAALFASPVERTYAIKECLRYRGVEALQYCQPLLPGTPVINGHPLHLVGLLSTADQIPYLFEHFSFSQLNPVPHGRVHIYIDKVEDFAIACALIDLVYPSLDQVQRRGVFTDLLKALRRHWSLQTDRNLGWLKERFEPQERWCVDILDGGMMWYELSQPTVHYILTEAPETNIITLLHPSCQGFACFVRDIMRGATPRVDKATLASFRQMFLEMAPKFLPTVGLDFYAKHLAADA